MIQKILVAVDGSDNNKIAVEMAIEAAKKYGAALTAITVFDSSRNEGMNYQKEFVQETNDKCLEFVQIRAREEGCALSTLETFGNPANCILEAAKDFDLVVCGTLGRTGMKRLLMGSVSEKLCRFSPCPVMVARDKN